MKHGIKHLTPLLATCLFLLASVATAQDAGNQKDVFKGKLFPPNIIMEHQDKLGLSKEQFTAIRAAVVEVQSNVAGYEWDLREAFQRVLSALDESPIDEDKVIESLEAALRAENEVKKRQVAMLVKLRNLLTDEQVEYLRSVTGQ